MENPGEVAILNVGAGDVKLSFDPKNPAERIRAARIVKDMLRRGFALLIEVDDGHGGKQQVRATDFDENTCEYIVADFDPEIAAVVDREEADGKTEPAATPKATGPTGKTTGRGTKQRVPAAATRTVAIGRSAGG